ncbi:MAG: thiolase family protein [Actinomycetota bacterium]|nr:thiolase family protein [Actinomycetota bacterium]
MIGSGVSIVGAGMVPFGERFEASYEDLLLDAWDALLAGTDGRVDPDRIEAAWLSTALGGLIRREAVTGASLADPLGFHPRPVTRVENACAGGSDAVRNAAFAVAAGAYDLVLVLGVEKMRDLPTRASLIAQRGTMSHLWWHPRGATSPYLFGQHATTMMAEGRITREDMARVSVKNHDHGRLNPNAFMRKPVSVEQVLASPPVCEPLTVLDCCPTTDGAAAVLLCRSELAGRFTDAPVELVASGLATDTMYSHTKPVFGAQEAPTRAAADAYKMAGIGPSDVDVAELHDCFTVAELLAYEDLGFCERGASAAWLASGAPALGGSLPCNPSGGLLSKGHPIGATGVAQLCEVFWQLRGEAGDRQVDGASIGLTHNVGGNGQVCCVNIARRG